MRLKRGRRLPPGIRLHLKTKKIYGLFCDRTPICTPPKFSIHTSIPRTSSHFFGSTSDIAKGPV